MKVGFIGAGNMAGALVRGIVAAGRFPAEDVAVTSLHGHSAQALAREAGVDVLGTNEELVEQTGPGGLVVLAVKPHAVAGVLAPLADLLAEQGSVVISLAAGTPLARLAGLLVPGQAVVRAMPNVNAVVGAGMTAVCGNAETDEDQLDAVVGLFETVGSAVVLPERDFPAYTAIAGSAPAFAALFVEALARGALRAGLPKALATRIAAQVVQGSARMILDGGTSPTQLADMVSSPGGTTIAGLCALEDAGFSAAVVRGVQATIDRDQEMARG
ncbi:pyrroline-5-carboxylate reductase [Georgenia sp. TF02-10]|uniref:pyrroline-5-carboxylate reductase n=1 Tax=Georgenia sp. TF02-10 TaxID=2917725 RepID=UPI001FA731AF|nr:pyrroline-5-carboxylate reductase [Georgenia sp. TF02-10]UNX55875.1 pyrroline-5-carboxylate reductase [Georgenia sp. TF02-10]